MSHLDARSRLSVRLVCSALRRLVVNGQHVTIHVKNFYSVKVRASPRVLALMHSFEPSLAKLERERRDLQGGDASTRKLAQFDHTKSWMISQYMEGLAPDAVSLTIGQAWNYEEARVDGGCRMLYKPHVLLSRMPLLASVETVGSLDVESIVELGGLRNFSSLITDYLDPMLLHLLGNTVVLTQLEISAGLGRRGDAQADADGTWQTMGVLRGSNFSGLKDLSISCDASWVGCIAQLTALTALRIDFFGEGSLLGVTRLTGLSSLTLWAETILESLHHNDRHLYQGLSALTALSSLSLSWGHRRIRWHPVPESSDLSVLSHLKQLRMFYCDALNNAPTFGRGNFLPMEMRCVHTATALTWLELNFDGEFWLDMEEEHLQALQVTVASLALLAEVEITTFSSYDPDDQIPCEHIQLYSSPFAVFAAAPNIRVLSLGVLCYQCDEGRPVLGDDASIRHVHAEKVLGSVGVLTCLQKLEFGQGRRQVELPGCDGLLQELPPHGLTSLRLRVRIVTAPLIQAILRFKYLQELVLRADHVALNSLELLSNMACLTSLRVTLSDVFPRARGTRLHDRHGPYIHCNRLQDQILQNARLRGVKGEVELPW